MLSVFDALTMLRPFDISLDKTRIGPKGDGGYVLADRLSPEQVVLSYGISEQYEFDAAMAQAGHQVLMFDPTIEGVTLSSPNMRFFKEGCSGKTDGDTMFTVADHLAKNNVVGERLILKMDVEGAEYDAICAMPDEVLARFEQIVMEIHYLANLGQDLFREKFTRFMSKLNKIFTIFHVHANNFDGPENFAYVEGLLTANLIELSFIKTSLVDPKPSRTIYPTELDWPNCGPREKLMWIYPYFPSSMEADELAANWKRVRGD